MNRNKMYIKVFLVCIIFTLICGDDIAQRLIDRYNDVRSECIDRRNKTKPACECSGLIMRAVGNVGVGQQKYAWSKKEANIRRNAFSASFLRRDQRFDCLSSGYESGFIYYPHLKTPKGKNKYCVYCAFPLHAHTDYRDGPHGCGQYISDTTGKSGDCAAQGIKSLKKWTTHLQDITSYIGSSFEVRKYQCSFNMTTKEAAKNFAVALEAKKHLRHYSRIFSMDHNELVIRAWNEDHPEKLPIEAFFYLMDYSFAREDAFMYQRDYLALTGETIPVVGIRLPQLNDPDLIVEYQEKK